jgi:hypothetical protein
MQQYYPFLGIIFISWVLILAIKIGTYLDKKARKDYPKHVVSEKACPPHRWAWEEQIGIDPPVYYIRCQRCRRLPGWERETDS